MRWKICAEIIDDYREKRSPGPGKRLQLLLFILTYYVSSANARSAHDSLTKPLFTDLLRVATGLLAAEKPEQALNILEPLLAASQQEDKCDSSFIAQVLFHKANSYMILNDPNRSIALYTSALRMTNDARQRGRLEINLGTAYFIREDYKRAAMHFRQALTILTDAQKITPMIYREISHDLGCACFEDNDMPSSLSWWQETLHINEKYFPDDSIWMIRTQVNLGALAFRSEDYETAGRYYKTALRLALENKQVSVEEKVPILKNLARSYLLQELCDSASLSILQAIDLVKMQGPPDPLMLADLLHLQGNIYRSCYLPEKADSVFYLSLSVLDSVKKNNRRDDFLFSLQRFRILRDLAFVMYFKYENNRNDPYIFDEAFFYMENAVSYYENLAGPSGANTLDEGAEDSVTHMYRRLLDLTFAKYQKEPSGYLDRYQELSRVLHNIDSRRCNLMNAPGQQEGTLTLQERLRAVKRRLYYISKRKFEMGTGVIPGQLPLDRYHYNLTQAYDSLQAILNRSVTDIPSYTIPIPAPTEAFLEYTFAGNSILIRVITRETDTIIAVPPGTNLINDISTFMYSIETADQKKASALGAGLYRTLIEPISELLTGKDKLVIAQDPSVIFLPFECLVAQDSDTKSTGINEHFLIRDFTISYALSIEKVIINNEDPVHPDYSYTFSGWAPEFPRDREQASLPFASREISEISLQFQSAGKCVACFSGLMADEESFLEMRRNSQILHIATHARTNPDEHQFSGILFSMKHGGNTDPLLDGIVELGELDGIDLNSELLVISSCGIDNGRSTSRPGEKFHPDLFLDAGARNVLYSLWNVMDKYTYRLMLSFYGHYLSGDTFSVALRKAKLELLQNPYTSAPAVWGGFILKQR